MIMLRGSTHGADAEEGSDAAVPFGLIVFACTIGFVSIIFAVITYRYFSSNKEDSAEKSKNKPESEQIRIGRIQKRQSSGDSGTYSRVGDCCDSDCEENCLTNPANAQGHLEPEKTYITEETMARKTQLITCLNEDVDLSGDEEDNEIFL